MKTVWLTGVLSLAMTATTVAHAGEVPKESGDPHTQAPVMKRRSTGPMAGGASPCSAAPLP